MEVLTLQQAQIAEGLAEGSLDLGLVNLLNGDDPPPGLVGTELLQRHARWRCSRADHPLAALAQVTVAEDLRSTDLFVMMRSGLPHAPVHPATLRVRPPLVSAVPTGPRWASSWSPRALGVTLLPDFSVGSRPPLPRRADHLAPAGRGRHPGLALVALRRVGDYLPDDPARCSTRSSPAPRPTAPAGPSRDLAG